MLGLIQNALQMNVGGKVLLVWAAREKDLFAILGPELTAEARCETQALLLPCVHLKFQAFQQYCRRPDSKVARFIVTY